MSDFKFTEKDVVDILSAHIELTDNPEYSTSRLIDRIEQIVNERDGWIRVEDRLPENYQLGMSKDVLTIAGTKMAVKSYDYELNKWNGSPHIRVNAWQPLPSPPKSKQ